MSMTPTIAERNLEFRYRHLMWLAGLGATTGYALVPLLIHLQLYPSAVFSVGYASYCAISMWAVRRYRGLAVSLSNIGVFLTILMTLSGIYLQEPDILVAHWVMAVPVVAFVLCRSRVAVMWTVATVLGVIAVHVLRPQNLSSASTAMLIIGLIAISLGLYAFANHIEQNERLMVEMGNTDALTGTLNRRAFSEVLPAESNRALRNSATMALFMIDVDHFKQYNDCYGHIRGDGVLVCIAEVLRHAARRSGDFVFRYGGEEFCILCSSLDMARVAEMAERIRADVEALALEHQGSPLGTVSVSVGYCHVSPLEVLTPHALIEAADKALYLAKANGRNRVERYAGDAVG